jgi:hypothetical protein
MNRRIEIATMVLTLSAGFLSHAGETAFTVTPLPLGTETKRDSTPIGIRLFVSRLDAREGFAAVQAKAAERWDVCPPDVKPERWISLVPVGIGARTDWLAFAFDAEGRPLCAARRPARQYDTAGIYPESIAPGDKQIDRNAGIELAADLGVAWQAADAKKPRLRIEMSVVESGSQQGFPLIPAEREGLRALAAAAALQAGPAADGDAPWSLNVSRNETGYALELLKPGSGTGLSALVPKEAVYPYLVRMIRALSDWGPSRAVSDFILVEPGGVRVMGWNGGQAFFDIGGSVIAFAPVAGLIEWTATIDPRYRPAYTWVPGGAGSGSGRPYSYHPSIAPIGQNGEVGRGPAGGAEMPWWGFALVKEDSLVIAQDRTLANIDRKKNVARWTWAGADLLTAGPSLYGGLCLVGGLAGELAAVNLSDGSLAWKTSVAARLSGPMAWTQTEPAYALVPSIEGMVFAFDEKGKPAWQADLGDTVMGELVSTKVGVLAAMRAGRVTLLNGRDGKVLAVWEAGAEAAGMAVMKDKICWAGRQGRVVWLGFPDLKVLRDVNLRARLNDGVVAGEGIPFRWGTGEEMGMRGDAAWVADEEGFAYVLPVP